MPGEFEKQTPHVGTREELGDAIRVILGSLPVGMEIKFFWKDGEQHLEMRHSNGEVEVARLHRNEKGIGTILPTILH